MQFRALSRQLIQPDRCNQLVINYALYNKLYRIRLEIDISNYFHLQDSENVFEVRKTSLE